LGATLKELGRLEDAEASYNKAIAIKPEFAEAHNNLGNLLQELGRLEDAEASYNKAIGIKPEYAEAHSNLGATLKELGRLEDAEASCKKAIAIKPDLAEAHNNLGNLLQDLGRLDDAETSYNKAIAIKPDYAEAHYNLGVTLLGLNKINEAEASYKEAVVLRPNFSKASFNLMTCSKSISDAECYLDKCLVADPNYKSARLIKAALRFYQGDRTVFDELMQSEFKKDPFVRSFAWVFDLPHLPELHFNRWYFYDSVINQSIISNPFYEFGVWRAASFKYLIKAFKKGYGFDTFKGLPEDWLIGNRIEKAGSYSSDSLVPNIAGGEFIVGKFEETLPVFFSKERPIASVINFDADLYSSTICALNFAKSVIDRNTILIFDELIMNDTWEQDEFKALNEFCAVNHLSYEVIAVSFLSKQVAVKLIGI
jgi:Flp pilus assembly protein TadD